MEELHGDLVVLQGATIADAPRFHAMLATPEVRRWWMWPDMEEDLQREDPKHRKFAVTVNGEVVGMLSWYEMVSSAVRYAGMDIFIDPGFHRRGYATDALRTLVRYLLGPGGHHRLVIDPHVDNAAAVACYEGVGFRPVGVMHRYIKVNDGPWEDALLMELLSEDADFQE